MSLDLNVSMICSRLQNYRHLLQKMMACMPLYVPVHEYDVQCPNKGMWLVLFMVYHQHSSTYCNA